METKSSEINELASALCKAQAVMRGAVKDSTNPFFKSKYADLGSVWDACKDALSANGLAVIQTTDFTPETGTVVITRLVHSSGQWVSGRLPVMAAKNDPQGLGSAITYARRYALAAIVGVVQVDDDAEAAISRAPAQAASKAPAKPMPTGQVPAKPVNKMVQNKPSYQRPVPPPELDDSMFNYEDSKL